MSTRFADLKARVEAQQHELLRTDGVRGPVIYREIDRAVELIKQLVRGSAKSEGGAA